MPKKLQLKCYFGCTVDGPLHRFPKWQYPHEEKFNSWKAVLSLTTQGYNNEYIYNNIRLCYRHFEKCFQLPSHQLTRNAVPTLHLCLSENLQVQAMPTITATSTSHSSSNETQQAVLNSLTQEQAIPTTATTSTYCSPTPINLPASDFDILLNVSKKDQKNRGMSGAILVTSYKRYKSRGHLKQIDLLQKTIKKLKNKCKSQGQEIRMAERLSKRKAFLEVVEKFPETCN